MGVNKSSRAHPSRASGCQGIYIIGLRVQSAAISGFEIATDLRSSQLLDLETEPARPVVA